MSFVDLTGSPPPAARAEPVEQTKDSSRVRKDDRAGVGHTLGVCAQAQADMTRDAGENANARFSLLQCENVLLILPSKATVVGRLRLQGITLDFKPDDADARGKCVDCSRVTGIQQSKPGSAKPRIKLIGGCEGGEGESTFDFSQATNGSAWRDTLKDAVAAIMRASQEPAAAPGASASGCEAAARDGSSSHRGVSQGEKGSCERGQPGMPSGAGGEGAEGGSGQVYRLDAAAIYKFMTEYPNLLQVYQRVVPHQMTEHDFWRGFLEARNFHQGIDAPFGLSLSMHAEPVCVIAWQHASSKVRGTSMRHAQA
jgi:hypothetical protein